MIELETMPILIDSHRAYLRSLAHPSPAEMKAPSRRQAIGRVVVRFGQWLDNHRPETLPSSPIVAGERA